MFTCSRLAYVLLLAACVSLVSAQAACSDGDLRLSGGNNSREGTVEICFDETWGTICDDLWDSNEAEVVCRQLGLATSGAIAIARAHFGQGTGPIYLDNLECTGMESRLVQCTHQGVGSHNCGHLEDAGVFCQPADFTCNDGEIRLVDGETENEGRVEICFDNQFGTICDDDWDNNDASVICYQQGFGREGAIGIRSAHYGRGIGNIYFDDVDCSGSEENITECEHRGVNIHNCGHSEDASVLCKPDRPACNDGDIRLVDGRRSSEGRVEICFNGRWGTICDDQWGTEEAMIVCRQQGFVANGSRALGFADFGMGTGPIFLDNLACTGSEERLQNCTHPGVAFHNCGHSEDAAVVCVDPEFICDNETVRLVDGDFDTEGRVEVCINNHWGTVCDDAFDNTDATVVCNQLGLRNGKAIALPRSFFGPGKGVIWFDETGCRGNETKLIQCPHRGLGINNCRHIEDANVLCPAGMEGACENGAVRLMNGTIANEGRVELCFNGRWGTICDDNWDGDDAAVICSQLGLPSEGALAVGGAFFEQGEGPIFLDNVECFGNETEILHCISEDILGSHNCGHSEDSGVICPALVSTCNNGDVRLVDGGTDHEGRVEICINSRWGTICDDSWDSSEARVVCRQLGFVAEETNAIAVDLAAFGPGTGPIFLDNLRCTGEEGSLLNCPDAIIGIQNCQHNEDAGVLCRARACTDGTIRLADGVGRGTGRVEVCVGGRWGTVCDRFFSSTDANFVCGLVLNRTSGTAKIARAAFFGEGSGNVHSFSQQCNPTSRKCQHSATPLSLERCSHERDVGVFCQVNTSECETGGVRLVGGGSDNEGRVEVCLNNQWGTVCDDSWDDRSAAVVCNQLKLPSGGAIARRGAFFGGSTNLPIMLDDVKCQGAESSLLECQSNTYLAHNCLHSEDAGVTCARSAQGGLSRDDAVKIVVPIVVLALLLMIAIVVIVGAIYYMKYRNAKQLDETPIVKAAAQAEELKFEGDDDIIKTPLDSTQL